MLHFQLPSDALKALSKGTAWNGLVEVEISKPNKRITRQQVNDAKKKMKRKQFALTEEEREIINFWNALPAVSSKADAYIKKNLAVSFSPCSDERLLLKGSLGVYDKSAIFRFMETYSFQCSKGAHRKGDHCFAYKNMYGFLLKLLEMHRKKTTTWWMKGEEVSAEDVKNITDSSLILKQFSTTFLDKPKYPNLITQSELNAVAAFSSVVQVFAKRKRAPKKEIVEEAFICMRKMFPENVFLMHLGNQKFLRVALPQHLKKVFGEESYE